MQKVFWDFIFLSPTIISKKLENTKQCMAFFFSKLKLYSRMKISDKSFAQRFDVAMTSFSREKNKIQTI